MAYQLNEGQGSLFTNSYKDINNPNDRSPHFKGHCVINGQEKDIAGWWAYPQNGGQPYLQLKITEPRQRQQPQPDGYVPQGQPQGGYAPQYPPQGGYQQPRQQYAQPQHQPQYAQAPAQATRQSQYQQPQPQGQPQYQQTAAMPQQNDDHDLPFD